MASGFDHDDVGVDRAHVQGGVDPSNNLLVGHAAVQQEHVDQLAGAGSLTVDAAQNASCAGVNTPVRRAAANALEPGNAPGLVVNTSR